MNNLFKSFVNNGIKIVPQLASDWELQNNDKNNSFNVHSSSLDQTFFIHNGEFLLDLIEKDITLIGNKIQGCFIFSKKRRLFTELEYQDWVNENENKQINQIDKKLLVSGDICLFEDNLLYVFLGSFYLSRRKNHFVGDNRVNPSTGFFTIPKLKNLFVLKDHFSDKSSHRYIVEDPNLRILSVTSVSERAPLNEVKDLSTKYYEYNSWIAYFSPQAPDSNYTISYSDDENRYVLNT